MSRVWLYYVARGGVLILFAHVCSQWLFEQIFSCNVQYRISKAIYLKQYFLQHCIFWVIVLRILLNIYDIFLSLLFFWLYFTCIFYVTISKGCFYFSNLYKTVLQLLSISLFFVCTYVQSAPNVICTDMNNYLNLCNAYLLCCGENARGLSILYLHNQRGLMFSVSEQTTSCLQTSATRCSACSTKLYRGCSGQLMMFNVCKPGKWHRIRETWKQTFIVRNISLWPSIIIQWSKERTEIMNWRLEKRYKAICYTSVEFIGWYNSMKYSHSCAAPVLTRPVSWVCDRPSLLCLHWAVEQHQGGCTWGM